jgi:Domain of unknown function (DUF222)/HNH endonuclease
MCSNEAVRRHADAARWDQLADEITQLASHIHAATCRWLALVAEFDRCGAWAQWGCRSCAHWVSWRCSIAPVAAREHVRVARRLQDLPRIQAAFAEGRLSYSKVRALSRVQNVEREEELLALAENASAAQLERIVGAYRGVIARARNADGGRPERFVSWHYDDAGALVLRARLSAEEGAVVLAALDAACASAEAPPPESERDADAPVSAGDERDASAEARPPESERDADAPIRAGDERDASAEAPQPESDRDADASVSAGDGRDASAEAPPPVAERRADALVLMADTLLATGPTARAGGDRFQVLVHVDAAALRGRSEGLCELADGAVLAPETARRLACDASIVPLVERAGRPLSVGRKTRTVPPALRRALTSRDRGCRFPGCTNHRTVDAHHIEHWAQGGATSVDNLVLLCRFHHRLLHEGGYDVARAGARLIFRRADGTEIRAVPRLPRGSARSLHDRHSRTVRPDACVPRDGGSGMDLGLCVDAMIAFAPLAGPPGI